MHVICSKSGGFCFGVKRAVTESLKLKPKSYILGEIIHNETVINNLKQKGVIVLDSLDGVDFSKEDTILIRTHGEAKEVFDRLNQTDATVVDCTCPFVKDIQRIVQEHYNKGYTIAIIGNAKHPEIIGINGWCNNSAYIVNSYEEIHAIDSDKLCIVVQTTYSEEKFNEIIKNFVVKDAKTVDIFKTICYTTTKRQKETECIAKLCQAVLVIGGKKSNNTDKLFEISKKYCKNVFRLTNPNDFDYEKIKNFNKVGVVLGASTPNEQFQEVISNMEKVTEEIITTEVVESEDLNKAVENQVETMPTESVKEIAKTEEKKEVSVKSEMEKAFDSIKKSRDFKIGQVITAKISSATDNGLTLSMNNAKKDFELPKEEILGEYNKADYSDKIGQDIRVMVTAKNPVKFSERAMEKVLKEEAEIEEIKNGKIFEVTVTATNKGGLTAKYGSYEVFVPSSQIKIGFAKDLEKYVGKTLRLKAEKVESRYARRQIVGSQRVILEAEKQERDAIRAEKEKEFFSNIQEGDVVLGTPVRFASFGAFIDVNGFDCLAHISDLSWTGCNNCADVLELGVQTQFKILKIDEENKRVSVGYKQLQPKPWDFVAEKYNVGDVVTGKVVRIVSFGAFVEVEKGVDGLVHVSQISNQWLENPVSALEVGQEVQAKIIEINPEKEKMTLSIKALLPEEPKTVKVEDEKPAKGKKKAREEESDETELREWKDESNSGASIADIIGGLDK